MQQQRVWAIPPPPLTSLSLSRRLPLLPFSSDIDRGRTASYTTASRIAQSLAEDSVAVFCDQTPSRRPCNLSPSPLSESNQLCQSLPITPPDHKVSRYYPPNLNSSPWRCIERSSLLVLSAKIHSGVVVSDRGRIGPFQASCSKDSDLDCCNYLDHFGVRFLACPFALL